METDHWLLRRFSEKCAARITDYGWAYGLPAAADDDGSFHVLLVAMFEAARRRPRDYALPHDVLPEEIGEE